MRSRTMFCSSSSSLTTARSPKVLIVLIFCVVHEGMFDLARFSCLWYLMIHHVHLDHSVIRVFVVSQSSVLRF